MNFILTFLALIPFYLIGAFPTGMMLAKSQGIDITKKGSGNVGATNIARVIGKKAGIITLLVDVSKGLIGSLIASLFADSYFVPLAGVILVAGHCFSLPPKLKGGKGVATALGVMLFINYTAALTGIGTFIIAFSIWRIVSLASLAGALIVPPAAVLIGADNQQTLCLFLISLIVLIRHRSNLQRLIEGKESKFR